MATQSLHPNDDNEDDDEVDTDEMILERIRVDTQSATDDILKTRDDIQKVQDAVVIQLDAHVDVVKEAEILQVKFALHLYLCVYIHNVESKKIQVGFLQLQEILMILFVRNSVELSF